MGTATSQPVGRIDQPGNSEIVRRRWSVVRGWALAPPGSVRAVFVFVGGKRQAKARLGLPRPDVQAAYPHLPEAATCGWMARVDLAGVEDTPVQLAAIVVTGGQKEVEIDSVEIQVRRSTRSSRPPSGPERSADEADRGHRIAVYTAIYGGYDDLKSQPRTPGVDFICFTDDPTLETHPWSVRVEAPRHPDFRVAAKWYKMFPRRALRPYRYSIWIDGSVILTKAGSVEALLSFLDRSGLALFPHPDRDNIYDEARASAEMPKYAGLPIAEQVEAYRRKGLPDDHTLHAGTVLVRDHSHRPIRGLGRRWWREILRWTYQDQLSLPYVLWRSDITPDEIPYKLWSNPLLRRDISTRTLEDS